MQHRVPRPAQLGSHKIAMSTSANTNRTMKLPVMSRTRVGWLQFWGPMISPRPRARRLRLDRGYRPRAGRRSHDARSGRGPGADDRPCGLARPGASPPASRASSGSQLGALPRGWARNRPWWAASILMRFAFEDRPCLGLIYRPGCHVTAATCAACDPAGVADSTAVRTREVSAADSLSRERLAWVQRSNAPDRLTTVKQTALLISAVSCLLVGCGTGGNTTIINRTVAVAPIRAPSQSVLAANTVEPRGKWCPTNRACFESVRWSVYDSLQAVGAGPANEGGGGLAQRHYPLLKVVLSRPQTVCGARRFTRAAIPQSEFAVRYELNAIGCQTFVYQPNESPIGSGPSKANTPTTTNDGTRSSARTSVNCGSIHNVGPNHADAFDISTTGLTCTQADGDLRGGIIAGPTSGRSANGFTCKLLEGVTVRCTAGRSEITYAGD